MMDSWSPSNMIALFRAVDFYLEIRSFSSRFKPCKLSPLNAIQFYSFVRS